jgi:cytidylate kinase
VIQHPTTGADESESPHTTALVLIGPPGCGKTTVRQLCSDYGVPGFDLYDLRQSAESTTQHHAAIRSELVEAEYTGPAVCVEGAVNDDEVAVIDDMLGSVLRIRLRAPEAERQERFVRSEVGIESGEAIDETAEIEARSKQQRRIRQESPYPDHDVVLDNGGDCRVGELTRRVGNILDSVGIECEQPPDTTDTVDRSETSMPPSSDDRTDVTTIVERSQLDPYTRE